MADEGVATAAGGDQAHSWLWESAVTFRCRSEDLGLAGKDWGLGGDRFWEWWWWILGAVVNEPRMGWGPNLCREFGWAN